MVAIISHAGQIDGCIGPCGAAIGKVEAVTAGIDATGEVAHVIVRQERIDGEVVEAGIDVIILVTDVIVTVATHRAATCRHSQVAGHPTATFLIDLAAHLHGRELDVFQTQHLVEHAGITQVHLGIEVGLHAVHVGGIVDGAFALDAAHSRHVGIQRMDVEALFVAAGLGLDFQRLIVRNILEGLTGLGHEFLDLVQVDFAVGVDGGFAVGLTVKHILVHMGIKLDVAALGLQLHVVEVQTVLVLVDSTAGVLDLQTAAFLAREVLDGHLHVLAIILKVLDLGIHILDLDVIRIKRGSRLVGLLARLGILSLAVFYLYLAGLDFPWLVIALVFTRILGHGMVLGVFLGILFAGMLIFHISLFDIQLAHVNRLFSRVNLHVLGFGMTHLGIKIIHSGLHIHLEVHIVGGDFVGIDLPGLARLLVGVRFLLLGLIAHFGLTALEGSIAHIHLVLVQVNLGPVDIGVFHVHIQIHRAIVGLDLALGTLE